MTIPMPGVTYSYDSAAQSWTAPGRESLLAGPAGWVTPPAITAGSAPIGTTNYSVPDTGQVIFVSPSGSDSAAGTLAAPKLTLEGAHSAASAGAVIVLRAGTYHTQLSSTKQITVQAYPGEAVWLDGSSVYSSWSGSGPWTAPLGFSWDPIEASRFGQVGDGLAHLPEQVWIDGVAQTQIADGATPSTGQFSVNRSTDVISIGTNPSGKVVRIADREYAIVASARINVYGIGMRRYSPLSVEGISALMYFGGTAQDSIIENCVFQESGMNGFSTARRMTLRNVTVQDCNNSGIQVTTADGILMDRIVVRRVNRGLWQGEPATSCIKVTYTDQLVAKNLLLSDSPGTAGFWFDSHVTRYKVFNVDVDGATVLPGGTQMTSAIEMEAAEGGFFNGVQHYGILINCRVRNAKFAYKSLVGGWHKYINCSATAYSSVGFYLQQDSRRNLTDTQHGTIAESPWLTKQISLINCDMGQGGLQVIAYHDPVAGWTHPDGVILGWDCFQRIEGNWFRPAPPGSMVQLGKADGYRNSYNTLAALAASPSTVGVSTGKLGVNHQGTTVPDDSIAVPLPADLAELTGAPVGLQRVGPFIPAPVASF